MSQLGQHFLLHQPTLQYIASLLEAKSGDAVVEVGSGPGYLTEYLQEFTLTCVEIDASFPSPPCTQYIQSSILDCLEELSFEYIIGNLPYHIVEPFFKQLSSCSFKQGVFLMGESFANTLVASPLFSHYFSFTLDKQVAPSLFHIPPSVQSRIVVVFPLAPSPSLFDGLLFPTKQKVKNYFLRSELYTKKEMKLFLAYFLDDLQDLSLHALSSKQLERVYRFVQILEYI